MKPEKYEWMKQEIAEWVKLNDKMSRYELVTALYDIEVHRNGGDATPYGDVELYLDKPNGFWTLEKVKKRCSLAFRAD